MAKNSGKSNSNKDPGVRSDTDLSLDAQQLRLDGVELSLANILTLKVERLEAELVLNADLEELAGLLQDLVSSLGDNPELLQNLTRSLTTTVEGVTEAATDSAEPNEEEEPPEDTGDEEPQEVRLTADEEGNLIETYFDEDGQITGERTKGSLEDLDITDAAGEKALDLGVDLSTIEGTGQGGRILVKDVEDAAEEAE